MPFVDIEVKRANGRDWYSKNREKCIEKARQRRRSPQYLHYLEASREKRREYKRKIRLEKGCVPREILSLRTAIKNIPQAPTVLDLIKTQQKEYWIERRKTPEGRADYTKHLYNTSVSTRLMQKEKRQRNKFKERNLYVEKITKKELLNRCSLFSKESKSRKFYC